MKRNSSAGQQASRQLAQSLEMEQRARPKGYSATFKAGERGLEPATATFGWPLLQFSLVAHTMTHLVGQATSRSRRAWKLSAEPSAVGCGWERKERKEIQEYFFERSESELDVVSSCEASSGGCRGRHRCKRGLRF